MGASASAADEEGDDDADEEEEDDENDDDEDHASSFMVILSSGAGGHPVPHVAPTAACTRCYGAQLLSHEKLNVAGLADRVNLSGKAGRLAARWEGATKSRSLGGSDDQPSLRGGGNTTINL